MKRLPATTVFYAVEFAVSMPAFVVTAVYFVRDVHWVIAAAWALWGFAYTFESGAFQAWITDEIGVERVTGVFLRGQRFAYAGGLLGLTGSVAVALWDRQAAVIAGGAVVTAAGPGCLLFMPETGFAPRPRAERVGAARELARAARDGTRYVRVQPLLLLIFVAVFVAGMSSEAFDRLWEAHFIRDIGLPAVGSLDPIVWFGLFGAVTLAVGLVASTVLLHRFDDASTPRLARAMFWFTAALMVGEIVFALSGSIALALGALLTAHLARSLINPRGYGPRWPPAARCSWARSGSGGRSSATAARSRSSRRCRRPHPPSRAVARRAPVGGRRPCGTCARRRPRRPRATPTSVRSRPSR